MATSCGFKSRLRHQFRKTCKRRSFLLRCEERDYRICDVRLRLTIPSLRSLQVPTSSTTQAHAKGAYKYLRKRVFFFVFRLFCLLFLSFALLSLLPTATALRSQIRFSLHRKDFFRFAIVRKGFFCLAIEQKGFSF